MLISLILSQSHTASENLVPFGSPCSQWSVSPCHSESIGKKPALSTHILESDDSIQDLPRRITSGPYLQSVAHPNHLIISPRGPLELSVQ